MRELVAPPLALMQLQANHRITEDDVPGQAHPEFEAVLARRDCHALDDCSERKKRKPLSMVAGRLENWIGRDQIDMSV